jgi:hypothetical protein
LVDSGMTGMLSILPVRIYPRARQIILTTAERHRLEKLAYSRTAGYQHVIRARIVLDAARGYANAEISRRRGVAAGTVRL